MAEAERQPILLTIPREFRGPRIVARRFDDDDAPAVHRAVHESMDRLKPWLPWYNAHETVDDTRAFIRRSQARYLLREEFTLGMFTHDGAFVGGVGLHPRDWRIPAFEIGYWVRTSAEGRGYVGEAVRLITTFTFETLNAQRVMIRCDAANTRSRAVAERAGYLLEGRSRRADLNTSGQPCDTLWFAMLPEEYASTQTGWPT